MQSETKKQFGTWSGSAAVAFLALILCFASTGYGDVIIGDWESTMDDWEVSDSAFVATPGTTTGATLHDYSLGVTTDTQNGWRQIINKSWGGWWQLTPFQYATTVSVDVTMIASEWTLSPDSNGIYPLQNLIVVGPSNWWEQISPVTYPDFNSDANRPGLWKPEDGDKTVTYTFNLAARGSDTFVKLIFVSNNIGDCDVNGHTYFDNAKIITSPLAVTKSKVKAGKTQYIGDEDYNDMKDDFEASGTVELPADINDITEVEVTITSTTYGDVIYTEALSDFNATVVNAKAKYTHSAKVTKGHEGVITSVTLDFRNGTFKIKAKNLDLTGLACPFQVKFTLGSDELNGNAEETVVNGTKVIPTRLMRLYDDKLVVTKAKAKHSTTALSDTLSVKGDIAVADMNLDANEPNLVNEDVVLAWGDGDTNNQTFVIPAGSFKASKKGHTYKCSKVEADANDGNVGIVAATIDLDKATFTVTVKNADNLYATPLGTAWFGISFDTEEGTFDEEDDYTLP
jgi:hypothetical protein